nr:YihY/virulence factor BrkB family protein [Streptomyces atroolivaceus]
MQVLKRTVKEFKRDELTDRAAGLTYYGILALFPALLVLVAIMLAILYWAAPNAKGRGFKFISLGSLLALVIWMVASAGFAIYVANFGSYNKTYGALAGVIIFLVWLWITNLAALLGLEFDAEMARERAIVSGHPSDKEPYAEPRDTKKWTDEDHRSAEHTHPATESGEPDERPRRE